MQQGMRTTILLITLFATLSCANTTGNHTSAKDGAKDAIVQSTEKKKIDGATVGALTAYVLLEGLMQHGLGLLIKCAIN
jgi:hypothetical protein